MKKPPQVSIPFHGAQQAELQKRRSWDGRVKDAKDAYDRMLLFLDALLLLPEGRHLSQEQKEELKSALVKIAAQAQRTAEDMGLFKREWIGGPEDG